MLSTPVISNSFPGPLSLGTRLEDSVDSLELMPGPAAEAFFIKENNHSPGQRVLWGTQ